MDLIELRKQIDMVDDKLMSIYKERIKLIEQVAEVKKTENIRLSHADRESQIIERLINLFGDDYRQDINALYPIIMHISKLRQARKHRQQSIEDLIKLSNNRYKGDGRVLKIATQGINGSYSTQACKAMFTACEIIYKQVFADVFECVCKGEVDYGVVPLENSNAGSINEVYDLLSCYNLYIAKAKVLPIQHCLVALPGAKLENIKTVYSHNQALYQCRHYIKKHNFEAIEVLNTAQAAKNISTQGDYASAAIASKETAELYALDILQDNIQDKCYNSTRFIAISKDNTISSDANKISLATVLSHKKGALLQLLNIIASYDINMTKIESRPIAGSNFEFLFHFDIQASIKDKKVQEMLFDIYQYAEKTIFLGGYKEE